MTTFETLSIIIPVTTILAGSVIKGFMSLKIAIAKLQVEVADIKEMLDKFINNKLKT
jgi:hypothetical protein